jgi:hypothetical protein
MSKLPLLLAAIVAAVMAIGFAGVAIPAFSQPGFQSRAECVKYCEQKCERSVSNGKCQQSCANRNGCF